MNPIDCEQGFSFSLWARIEMDSVHSQLNGTASTTKRYLLSTGGWSTVARLRATFSPKTSRAEAGDQNVMRLSHLPQNSVQ